LGRPASFDQKKDSIVRVQFHRLRDRLSEYYQSDGANHAVRIEIPQGQYIPQFVHLEAPATVPHPTAHPSTVPTPGRFPKRVYTWIGIAGVVELAAAIWLAGRTSGRTEPRAAAPAGALPGSDSLRILVGLDGGAFTDGFGNVWQSDRFFEGGSV